jgi:hypothetical protein
MYTLEIFLSHSITFVLQHLLIIFSINVHHRLNQGISVGSSRIIVVLVMVF